MCSFNLNTWYSRFPPRMSPPSFECVHSFVFFSSVSYDCRQTAIILPYLSTGHTIRLQKLHHRSLLVFGLSYARCNVLHAFGLLLIAPKPKQNNCLWSRLHLLVADNVVNKANKFSVTTTLYFLDPLLHVSAYMAIFREATVSITQTHSKCSHSSITHCNVPLYKTILHAQLIAGDRGSAVVKVLCYKSEGRWFDPSWCHWNFSLT